MDGLESWTHWTNILNTAASCHGRIADLCWHLRFSAISADLKQWFPLISIFHKLLTGDCYEMFADCFLMFLWVFSDLNISQFNWEPLVYIWGFRAFGSRVGGHWRHLRGSLGLAGHLRNLFRGGAETTAHSGTSLAGSGALGCWGTTCRRSGSWPRYYICPRVYIIYIICTIIIMHLLYVRI